MIQHTDSKKFNKKEGPNLTRRGNKIMMKSRWREGHVWERGGEGERGQDQVARRLCGNSCGAG